MSDWNFDKWLESHELAHPGFSRWMLPTFAGGALLTPIEQERVEHWDRALRFYCLADLRDGAWHLAQMPADDRPAYADHLAELVRFCRHRARDQREVEGRSKPATWCDLCRGTGRVDVTPREGYVQPTRFGHLGTPGHDGAGIRHGQTFVARCECHRGAAWTAFAAFDRGTMQLVAELQPPPTTAEALEWWREHNPKMLPLIERMLASGRPVPVRSLLAGVGAIE